MNKACFALILALTFVSALSSYADIGDAYRHYYGGFNRPHNTHETIDAVCLNAVAGVNTAISQLLFDARVQSNLWIIYADLDALDESSYYLTHTCHSRSIELSTLQEPDQTQTQVQSQACADLISIVGTILGQDGGHVFSHGYEKGMELSAAALDAGREVGNGCEIVLRPAQPEDTQGGDGVNDEEELSLEEQNDESGEAELIMNMRTWSNTETESDEDDLSDDDSDDLNDSSDDDISVDYGDSDDGDSDEDSDLSDDEFSGSLSWGGSKGLGIKISKSKNGNDDDYIISYDPAHGGFSVKHVTSDDEDASDEENNEEWNSEEWDNDGQKQELLPLFYSYSYDYNYNNDEDNKSHKNGSRIIVF